jgi:subtilisin family serine protease
MALEDTISLVVFGGDSMTPADDNDYKRPDKGSPVIFSSGNSASGWVKITAEVPAGSHSYEWRLLRTAFPPEFTNDPVPTSDDDTVWLDQIVFSDGETEGFEADLTRFENGHALNQQCDANCTDFVTPGRPVWELESDITRVFSGLGSVRLNAANSDCGNSYLSVVRTNETAGEISFWVWVSTDTSDSNQDKFEFLIDGQEVFSFGGDTPSQYFVDNNLSYLAELDDTIAVGASWSGDLSGATTASLVDERRVYYSQFGAKLDLVAPSSDQHLGITTTDRTGSAQGYNRGTNSSDLSDNDYTNTFGGTSASAPMVAGAAAAIIAVDDTKTAEEVRAILRESADKIGQVPYSLDANSGLTRNNEHGFGRLNMYKALQLADTGSFSSATPNCTPDAFTYTPNSDVLLSTLSQTGGFCPAMGPLPASDELCFPINATNGKMAVVCL